jgi:hypothetical protein
MSQETTHNLLEVMRTFQWPEPNPITYRLYHDENGAPLIYTMEELEGDFVEIDQATYIRASWRVKVVQGKIVHLPPVAQVNKLVPDHEQGVACDTRDVCVVLGPGQGGQHWRLKSDA